jgi:mono/diheme cytochrome c family protein
MTMRIAKSSVAVAGLSVVLSFLGGTGPTLAQNVEHGRRLSERWCSECHAVGPSPGKFHRASSFAAIAAKPAINSDVIASFLLLPHATMRNLPLSREDAEDIAAFILK